MVANTGCRTFSREFVTFLSPNNLNHFVEKQYIDLLGSDETPRRVQLQLLFE